MKILNRYIIKTMGFYTLAVLFIWLGVYGFLNFINEIDAIGQANYTAPEAISYVIMDLPAVAYSHSSIIILLGSLLALGHLASTSQLIIVRASGLSVMQIALIVVRTALAFVATIIIFGELVVPLTTEYAENSRAKALGRNITAENQQGFWLKDGDWIVHVKKNFGGRLFENILLINISQLKQLDSVIRADRAAFNGDNLNLAKVNHYQLDHTGEFLNIQSSERDTHKLKVSFDQVLSSSLNKEPYELSTWNLYKQINFLTNNNLAASAFEVEFYKRLVKPITLAVMLLFAMLFIFGSLRDASLGKNIFFGLIIGLCFELISRIGGALSLRFDYNPFLIAFMPTLIALGLVLFFLKTRSEQ